MAAAIPSSYGVITIITMAIYRVYPKYRLWRWSQRVMFITLPPALMMSLGGLVEGSAVIIWAVIPPMGALVYGTRRESMFWFASFVLLLVGAGALESTVRSPSNLPGYVQTGFFAVNLTVVPGIAFMLLGHFVQQQRITLGLLNIEREKSESLLLNVLPAEVSVG